MPRPRKGVTAKNLHEVDRYFSRLLKENRSLSNSTSKNFNLQHEAKRAYDKLPALEWHTENSKSKSMQIRIPALQNWIDKYVTAVKWQRCLLTLRQNKSRKKLKLKRLDLQLDVYLNLKLLAKKQGRTIGETIHELVKPALKKAYRVTT